MKLQSVLFPALVAVLALSACGDDMAKQGFRDPCAAPSGVFIGCEIPPIENSEDLCWRLVECGVIPIEDPPEDEGVFAWNDCVSRVDELDSYQFDFAATCVRTASCDDLKVDGSPNNPRSVPLCLRHGNQ